MHVFYVITHHAQAKKGVSWGVISYDNYATKRIKIVQSYALGTWAGAPCRQSARRPSHAAPHATGSTPPGPVPLPVCRRQWLRLRRQVLRLRLPRLYTGGGPTRHGVDPSRTGARPSFSASVAAAATTGSASAAAAAIQGRWRRDCLAAFWLLILPPVLPRRACGRSLAGCARQRHHSVGALSSLPHYHR